MPLQPQPYDGPGARLLRWIARLVPESERDSWLAEWQAELHGAHARALERYLANAWARVAIRMRLAGALRDAWWLHRRKRSVSMTWADVQLALRGIRRRPGFAATMVVTLGVGMGGSTAIFSVIDPLLLRPLPYPEADRLADIYTVHPGGNAYEGVHPDVWRTMRAALVPGVFDRLEGGAPRSDEIAGRFEPEYVRANALTPGTLSLLGARAKLGRLFDETDAQPGAANVAVVSESFWRRTMGGDAGVLGSEITFSGASFTVIGVMEESFRYPIGTVQLWYPLRVEDPIFPVNGYETIARLREGVTDSAAQRYLDGLSGRREGEAVEAFLWDLVVRPVNRSLTRAVGTTLFLLAGAIGCVLLIGCANAANLMLVRGAHRQTELAVRRSLGATSGRLFRQLVTESVVLSLMSGVMGIALAFAGVRALLGMIPRELIEEAQASAGVDTRILAFSMALSLLTGLLFGAGPAVRAARQVRLSRASERTMTASASLQRMGSVLVVVELALSMALLVSAGLMARSFATLVRVDPGFESEGLTVANLMLPTHRYPDDPRTDAFYDALRERLIALPGVAGVSVSDGVPPRPGTLLRASNIEAEGMSVRANAPRYVTNVVTDDGYFDVLGIPILEGRKFGPEDSRSSPRVAIIDPDLAQLLWPGASPLGQRFRMNPDDEWMTVTGIAGSVRMLGPDDRTDRYELYTSARQETPWRYRAVAVRSAADEALVDQVRAAIHAIDPELPILALEDGETRFGGALARQRFVLQLMVAFTTMALLLAGIGTFGVAAYLVAQRRREIGLRIALGATPNAVAGSVLLRGVGQAAMGAAAGALLTLATTRFLESMLYGVEPTDPFTLGVVGAVLGLVAAVASLVPAVRASRVSPLEALRVD